MGQLTITLPDTLESEVRGAVSKGDYGSVSDFIRDAIRLELSQKPRYWERVGIVLSLENNLMLKELVDESKLEKNELLSALRKGYSSDYYDVEYIAQRGELSSEGSQFVVDVLNMYSALQYAADVHNMSDEVKKEVVFRGFDGNAGDGYLGYTNFLVDNGSFTNVKPLDKELNGRVSLTVYRDSGDAYTAQVLSGLQSDTAELLAKLDAVSLDGGGDTPEATLHALKTTFDGLAWKDGATKAAIVLTDAGFHQPDRVDDSTVESVAKRSLEIDPVNVYPVVPSGVAPQYHELASKTTGQVIVDTGDTVAALTQALSKIETRPTALLKNTEYSAEPGKEVTYDASDSYVVDATITKYEWDINGDGTFEYTTTTPIVSHTYSANLDGTMQVRLTASNGTVANASAFVKIGTKELPQTPKAPTNITANVISTKDQKSTITLNWTPADTFATKWIIAVNGVEIGYVTGNRTSLDLTDVDRTLDVELSITGATVKNELGNPGTTILAKYVTPPVQPPTTNSWLLQLIECVRRLLASLGILI